MKYEVSHKGEVAQIVRIAGGTKTIKPGAKNVAVETATEISEAQIEHYKARGVTFKKPGRKARDSGADKKKTELMPLQKAVKDAEAAVAAVAEGDDEAKAAAQALLEDAEKALDEAEA